MIATDFARDDCLVGTKRRTYAALKRDWRCNEYGCGGRIVGRYLPAIGWHVACGRCGSQDFIHECELLRQQPDAREVLAGLPEGLAEMLKGG